MTFKLKGASVWVPDDYREGNCAHAWGAAAPSKHFREVQVCTACQGYRVWSLGGWEEMSAEELNRFEKENAAV